MKRIIYETPDLNSPNKAVGKLWCPYCGDWTEFKVRAELKSNYDRCTGCTISTEDYYVKCANGLWGMTEASAKARERMRTTKTKKGK